MDSPQETVTYTRTHTWVAGMMYVHAEDVEDVAAARPVECERCERTYASVGDPYGECD
jgi:hypothetical protein